MDVKSMMLAFYESEHLEIITKEVANEVLPILRSIRKEDDTAEILAVVGEDSIVFNKEDISNFKVITEETLMRDVNFGKKLGTCVIVIYPNDNYDDTGHPHVHVVPTNGKPNVCVRLDVPEYFDHGHHKGKFNNSQAKLFDTVMRQRSDNTKTIWERAVKIYNDTRSPKITLKEQPDYTRLNDE